MKKSDKKKFSGFEKTSKINIPVVKFYKYTTF